ncbi:endonuclease III [Methylacidimicrobium cyclopophantes]|uniref:endonuclease III n=1 Tax=Methylacidimicrobium cyclopophantes TaxID=1041766 RepID=UPI00115A9B19|nr:endonuclease III [Methylacidimicrobium cyclopophantes]
MTRSEQRRIAAICRRLAEAYPETRPALHYRNPLELLIATILSARCTDRQVNRVTADIFSRFPDAASYAAASQEEMEEALKRLGFFRSKARHIRRTAAILTERWGGRVPKTMEELTELPGVGRKTANVVLGNGFGLPLGIVVDTHVARVSYRLGLTDQKLPKRIEIDLMQRIPRREWIAFSNRLIFHGRKRCRARKPDCLHCELLSLCPRQGLPPLSSSAG